MIKKIAAYSAFAAVGALLALAVVLVFYWRPAFAQPDTVEICHATGSSSNPYVVQHPSKSGDVSGHDGHGGDIIPPFTFNGGSYPGKNWNTTGRAIYDNGCKMPAPPTATDVVSTSTAVPSVTPVDTNVPTSTAVPSDTPNPSTSTPVSTSVPSASPEPTTSASNTPKPPGPTSAVPSPTFIIATMEQFVVTLTPCPICVEATAVPSVTPASVCCQCVSACDNQEGFSMLFDLFSLFLEVNGQDGSMDDLVAVMKTLTIVVGVGFGAVAVIQGVSLLKKRG